VAIISLTSKPLVGHDLYLTNLYTGLLGRAPDAVGFANYQTLANSQSCAELAAGFFDSVEFQTRNATLSNSDFLNATYAGVLGRPIDPTGQAGWLAQMSAGLNRSSVASLILKSTEFNLSCASTFGFIGAGSFTITIVF
jgi:hypothetical protein